MTEQPRKPSEKQVQAWLYFVVGPVVDGLKQEVYFLDRQNPTWRFRQKRCEFLQPAREYVDRAQHPTFGQFLRYNEEPRKLVESHDSELAELELAAARTHAALVKLEALQQLLQKIEREFSEWRGAYRPEDGANLLAENIVNLGEVRELGPHYSNAEAWKVHGQEALALRTDPTVAPTFAVLHKSTKVLGTSTKSLKTNLETLRDQFADDYGLPPVPASARETFETFEETF